VDVERDVLGRMGFRPRIPAPPRPMDPRIFRDGTMGLAPVPSLDDAR
jgi:propionate CoA-transferase